VNAQAQLTTGIVHANLVSAQCVRNRVINVLVAVVDKRDRVDSCALWDLGMNVERRCCHALNVGNVNHHPVLELDHLLVCLGIDELERRDLLVATKKPRQYT
jgi:hypothetical protein